MQRNHDHDLIEILVPRGPNISKYMDPQDGQELIWGGGQH